MVGDGIKYDDGLPPRRGRLFLCPTFNPVRQYPTPHNAVVHRVLRARLPGGLCPV
ncbi:hypothetical protein ARMSODRAFT_961537, partial [Armillaria solidipes]